MRGGGSEFETRKSNLLPAESELELGLGLSIGGGAWRERGRILTAKDFPSVGSKRAADSSSNQGQGASPPRSSQIVGWPPIGSHRMNKVNNQAMKAAKEEEEEEGKKKNEPKDVSVQGLGYVKVNMDGVGIGRKVEMRAHSSYENLAQTLEEMFFGMTGTTTSRKKAKPLRLLDGSSEFVLTYEDKEGDWMLVGDVPWRMFITSVKRLRIMGTSEANGLGISKTSRSEGETETMKLILFSVPYKAGIVMGFFLSLWQVTQILIEESIPVNPIKAGA
ncbi:hypothetical protein F2Q70_00019369 [Brassica cretica]|uniref:Auxin-responsive protein n=1 Tax=Brassica cretica TaxID=69181 RepID=A0A8S9GVJ9_BRACR|nr:hypothetical protein F2Q70_00019369 [Brassica cretica]